MKTKEKILVHSAELFNRNGVGPVTTNHIAKAMNISPGNLYFHYSNKEEIILELFRRMCKETYSIWRPKQRSKMSPMQFIDENFELYWKYRFFHREMYALRRKDVQLAKMWRAHIQKMMKLMQVLYRRWVSQEIMAALNDKQEMIYVSESLLAMATTFLQFFESAEKQPGKNSVDRGKRHVARLLLPYSTGKTKDEFEKFIRSEG
jgi:AcrR family transcriptional regulator